MKLRASLKRKTVHVFRQNFKATKFVNIKYSKQTCRIFHDLFYRFCHLTQTITQN
jgi:predicted fused transcriptional regulator/phosphomethylpyrimidine kinase